MENIIEVKSLVKVFGNQTALEGANFQVKKGEIFGFLGPSGSGKTTTIKILTGQLTPTSGDVEVFGKPYKSFSSVDFRRKIGILTDNSGLYERLSIYDNLKLYCDIYSVSAKRIDDVLDTVNLKNDKKKIVSKLSKGMKQRVTLARALLHEPELLFLDEPTSALDPVNTQAIYKGLRALNKKGTTIFLTTHDMSEAETLCNRVAFLNKGKIQLLDSPKALRRQYSDDTFTVELKDGKQLRLPNGPESAPEINELLVSNHIASIYSNEPTLGDIFVKVTGRELV